MNRYAVYFAPAPQSAWTKLGRHWLGRDAFTGTNVSQVRVPSLAPEIFSQLTQIARRYGFHATLKAPFRLREGWTEKDLLDFACKFCSGERPLPIYGLRVDATQGFVALRLLALQPEINQCAFRCVRDFDCARAPLTEEEFARQAGKKLSPRQMDLLRRRAYPYVEEEFQFHFTLCDDLAKVDQDTASILYTGATQYFAPALNTVPLIIDGISIFREEKPDASFKVVERIPFGGKNESETLMNTR